MVTESGVLSRKHLFVISGLDLIVRPHGRGASALPLCYQEVAQRYQALYIYRDCFPPSRTALSELEGNITFTTAFPNNNSLLTFLIVLFFNQ